MNFEAFKEAIKNDAELNQALVKYCEEKKPADEAAKEELLIEFAREHGFEITAEDLILLKAERKELDEKELEIVAGGEREPGIWCLYDHFCLALFMW